MLVFNVLFYKFQFLDHFASLSVLNSSSDELQALDGSGQGGTCSY